MLGDGVVFECRLLREVSFKPCACPYPPSTAYEYCHYVTGLQEAGEEALFVRLRRVARPQAILTNFTSFRWRIGAYTFMFVTCDIYLDASPPVLSVGQYSDSDGSLLNLGPPPCINPQTKDLTFEISTNEFPATVQCRLLDYDLYLADFRGAMGRWSTTVTQKWVELQQQSSDSGLAQAWNSLTELDGSRLLHSDLSTIKALSLNVSDSQASQIRERVLLQETPWQTCGYISGTESIAYKILDALDNDGLKLFQSRAIDLAGNVGKPTEYIFFSGTSYA